MKPNQHVVERWLAHVRQVDDCLLFRGLKDRDGYGYFRQQIDGRRYRFKAHRVAYEQARGPIPDGQVVRHTCDRRACLNPDHLLLGTQADNVRDTQARGRARNRYTVHTLGRMEHVVT